MKSLHLRLIQLGAHIGETVVGTNHFTDYYVLGIRNGYYIIDLSKTIIMLRSALRFLKKSSMDGCNFVLYHYNADTYEIITLFLYKLSKLLPLNILYQRWVPGFISNYYSCFYDLLNEIQDLNWVDSRKKISFIDIFFKLLYFISIDKPVDLTLEEQYDKSLSYWRAALFFRYFRNYYYLPDVAICLGSGYTNKIYQEFSSLGIPVVASVSTKSNFQFVSYPIISNNSSVLLSLFYLSLFSSIIIEGRKMKYSFLFANLENPKVYSFLLKNINLLRSSQRRYVSSKHSQVFDKKEVMNRFIDLFKELIKDSEKKKDANKVSMRDRRKSGSIRGKKF